jgi:hypothetical protein
LRAEAEPLKLVQIEFVEIRGRIFFGSVVVHGVRNPAGAGRVLVANWCVAVRNQNAMSAARPRGGKQFSDGATMINDIVEPRRTANHDPNPFLAERLRP